ncbi:MAG: hypothetical protein HY306_11390 [Nitrosomonadales bacterium]|nr:hypothetical protein [Nitrosomonadales bacterium]
MKNIHLLIPELFLPQPVAAEVCAGLKLPALEKLLARAQPGPLAVDTLEDWLCAAFGVAEQAIAPVTLRADGVDPGAAYWLRADPVYLQILRNEMILQSDLALSAGEAAQLCASLNAHFAAEGLSFVAPHPQRWYLRTDTAPDITTRLLSKVEGQDVHQHLPQGADALRWHRTLNEVQMLLYAHPVNEAREARGVLPANSVWLWGGGQAPKKLEQPYAAVCGDSELAMAFARASGSAYGHDMQQCIAAADGDVLVVWDGLRRAVQRGELGAWRDALQQFELDCVAPVLNMLRAGQLATITLDVLQPNASRRFVLTRRDLWKFWRKVRRLEAYPAE